MKTEQKIRGILEATLKPVKLDIRNDSHLHASHASSPGTGESHFTVTVVSNAFLGKSRVARHQMIYNALKDLMEHPIHALAIHAHTPEEKPD